MFRTPELAPGLEFISQGQPSAQRSDIKAPLLDINIHDKRASEKYIFASPQSPCYQSGPTIYDARGELIWSGAADGFASGAYAFHACDYQGSTAAHLCMVHSATMFGNGCGLGLILDASYRIVRVIQLPGGTDMHEFSLVDHGTRALVTQYPVRHHDFAHAFNPQGLQTVYESVFIELDLWTEGGSDVDAVTYRWNSLDHVKVKDAARSIDFKAGKAPHYDYFHINSVAKNANGDYLVCARHTSAVYKVSGVDGSIIWTLSSGPESDFQLVDFVLWGPHHAQWRSASVNDSHTVLTLFNNGRDGPTSRTNYSSGMVIALDHESSRVLSDPPNSNVLLGWGSQPHITEHLEDGTLVFHASIAGGGSTYRVSKSDWVGRPSDAPALWSYARTAEDQGSPTVFYVSWNGATEVYTWNFYAVGDRAEDIDSLRVLGSKQRTSFETNFTITEYVPRSFVEAVARDGRLLGNSSVVPTWVPGDHISEWCDDWVCPERESEFRVRYNTLPDLRRLPAPDDGIGEFTKPYLGSQNYTDYPEVAFVILNGLISGTVLSNAEPEEIDSARPIGQRS
ncbi:Uu.00g007390.m01.CDS01 [Anthostomella pinea]|uniref:Uu.00g007390.m01.CDS01 n=1 Tax=Anthostomella pinea TaxID=933095 RepID=A0AAI8YPU7_9PEZI|nr:Uu.00g007390.m01.CDS01 [Anthostomella pinea]